jgi:hypothetical protein
MVNAWRPRPGEASIVTSILALRLANRSADGMIGTTTEACLHASSNSVGMSDGIHTLLWAQRRIHPPRQCAGTAAGCIRIVTTGTRQRAA